MTKAYNNISKLNIKKKKKLRTNQNIKEQKGIWA